VAFSFDPGAFRPCNVASNSIVPVAAASTSIVPVAPTSNAGLLPATTKSYQALPFLTTSSHSSITQSIHSKREEVSQRLNMKREEKARNRNEVIIKEEQQMATRFYSREEQERELSKSAPTEQSPTTSRVDQAVQSMSDDILEGQMLVADINQKRDHHEALSEFTDMKIDGEDEEEDHMNKKWKK